MLLKKEHILVMCTPFYLLPVLVQIEIEEGFSLSPSISRRNVLYDTEPYFLCAYASLYQTIGLVDLFLVNKPVVVYI